MTRRLAYFDDFGSDEPQECYYQHADPTEERWSEEIGLESGGAGLEHLEEIVKAHPCWAFLVDYLRGRENKP